ncbi:hypothetical protein GLN3_17350 (plasmid) [Geobacillus lituanicus]|nr:hypothetical protein GLN3_17165 [Geobacillus lituanicus]ASS88853.1 hypothetical protein GLN3_17350 [Geobacillus lituanicus]
MLKKYNLFYYYGLLFNGLNKIEGLIKENNIKKLAILTQICAISGIIAVSSTLLNSEILSNL